MSIKVVKLGFLGLNCVQPERSRRYYSDVMGLPIVAEGDNGIFFGCGLGSHALSLHASKEPGFRHLGLQISGTGPLDDVLTSLHSAGLAGEIRSGMLYGVQDAVEIIDPDGYRLYLYREETPGNFHFPIHGIAPQKLGHVALRAGEAKRSERFYVDNLGFCMSDWIEDVFVFLRCNRDHHTVNFLTGPRPGLFHFAFELRDASHLIQSCDILGKERLRIDWGPGRHGPGHNLYTYHRDPEGNIIELFAELDTMIDESLGYFDPRPYHGDSPQKPKVWTFSPDIDVWGAPPPSDFSPFG